MREIMIVLLWLLLGVFLAWRLKRCAAQLRVVVWEISYVVFYAVGTVLMAVLYFLPKLSRGGGIAVVVVYVLFSAAITYRFNRKYDKWREEQLKKAKNKKQ